MKDLKQTQDDTQTLDEMYRQQWYEQLSSEHQALALAHQQDQYDAVPSYFERFRTENREGGAACR